MKKVFSISMLCLWFAAYMLLASCGGGYTGKKDGQYEGHYTSKIQVYTPKGVLVQAGWQPEPEMLAEIDKGLDNLFRIVAAPPYNYKGFQTHASYQVGLFPRSPQCQDPGFTVEDASNQYDGSQWDKDPNPGHTLLCVAGMMVRWGILTKTGGPPEPTQGKPGMVIVNDVGIAANITRFEGEHNVAYECDLDKYLATQYHTGTNGGHPIFPDPQTGQLVGRPEYKFPHGTTAANVTVEGQSGNALLVK